MNRSRFEVRTPQKGVKVGNRAMMNGRIVMIVKAGKQEDYITAEQLVEAMYGIPVEQIRFRDESLQAERGSEC